MLPKRFNIFLLVIFALFPGACSVTEEPVIIATREVSNITYSSAIGGGIIIYGEGIKERGIVWDKRIDPVVDNNPGIIRVNSGDDEFAGLINGLEPETVYYIRAYARNNSGISYGDQQSFRTFLSEVSDIDGNIYFTIKAGDRIWMSSNLTTGSYSTGEKIPHLTDAGEWNSAATGAWSSYNNDPELHSLYGKLYNWHAVADERGLCPAGWHVPTDQEWKEFEKELGMTPSSAERSGLRDRYAGGKLKETGTKHWLSPNILATNEAGFSALPGGYRHSDGRYYTLGRNLNWWTSTGSNQYNAWYRNIYYNNAGIYRNIINKNSGFSVLCIKDRH